MKEAALRDIIMKGLYEELGVPGSWGAPARLPEFAVRSGGLSGQCFVEERLTYKLSDSVRVDHKSDIQFEFGAGAEDLRHVAVELKHESAVSDQFKARAYDMLHIKRERGVKVHGVMVYAKAQGKGLSLALAEAYAHPFDGFVGVQLGGDEDRDGIEALTRGLAAEVRTAMGKWGG